MENVLDAAPVSTGVLHQLDKTGDTEVKWNRASEVEVDVARRTFDTLKAKGYMAYKMTAGGGQGEILREFDPAAERIIMRQQMMGG